MNHTTRQVYSAQWRPLPMQPVRQMGGALRPRPRVVTHRLGQASKVKPVRTVAPDVANESPVSATPAE